MANIESKNLLVAVKAFARANAFPLDKDEVWESLSEAQAYAASPLAYAGQTIKVLINGKYQPYILQPATSGGNDLVLEESGGGGASSAIQIVDTLPTEGQVQGVIYLQTSDNAGYIWTGDAYKLIFKDVSVDISKLQEDVAKKADLDGAIFTGEVLLHADPTQSMGAVTKQYVDRLFENLTSVAPGVVDSQNPLPEGYSAGQTWRVAEAGLYAGQYCEIGDLILCVRDYAGQINESDFIVVQANIDGAVVGPESSTDAALVIFDGTTGKKLASSTVTIASVEEAAAMRHVHSNFEVLESFTKTEQELEKTIDKIYSKIDYEVSHKPEKVIVDYRDKEIRILCPEGTPWSLQNSGEGSDANSYYLGFKAYAPNDSVVSFKESLAKTMTDDTMYYFEDNDFAGIDEYGRKYSIIWLPAARYDTSTGLWTYYGDMSSVEKYIGWYYSVEWYDADGNVVASDCIRINLSNKDCHSAIEHYYIGEIKTELQAAIDEALVNSKAYTDEKIGDIPVGTTVKQYIDNSIGSGGTDAAEAIATAKAEAIVESKAYTDEQLSSALKIVEF